MIVGSILATDSCEKESVYALPEVVGFLQALRFPPCMGKDDRARVRINIIRKVISQLL